MPGETALGGLSCPLSWVALVSVEQAYRPQCHTSFKGDVTDTAGGIVICDRFKKTKTGASLVAQWLRICLLMQGTRVRALVWEDPTCRGAAGPVSHNY